MKVLMLRSNPISPDSRLEKEAITLGKAGYDVQLLGWQRYGDANKFEKKLYYDIKRIKFPAPLGKKVIFYLPIWWFLLYVQLMKEDWDIVHAVDLDTFIPAVFAAKLKKKKIISDIFDFYIDMVYLPKLVRNCITMFDRFLMRFSDAIIIVDPSRLKQLGKKKDSAIIIFNSPSDILTDDSKYLQPNKSFKIFYAGGLYRDRDFKSIINIIKKNGTIKLDIAGWGECEKEIVGLIKNQRCISFIGSIPYEEVLQRTLNSDLVFALYDPSILNNRYASPNKLFEAMMCRKPIIVSDGTSMADIVREENCGLVVPYGNTQDLENAILKLKNDPELCNQLGSNGRKAYDKKYNWEIMEKRLLDIYNKLLKIQRNATSPCQS